MNKISKQLQADWPLHISYDQSDSDVDNFYSSIRGALTESNSIFYDKRQVDIFLLAMAMGKKLKHREKIKKPSQSIRRDAMTEEETWLMCCVALSEEGTDLDILADSKRLITICEEYANAGIKSIIELDRQTDRNNGQYEKNLEEVIGKLG